MGAELRNNRVQCRSEVSMLGVRLLNHHKAELQGEYHPLHEWKRSASRQRWRRHNAFAEHMLMHLVR